MNSIEFLRANNQGYEFLVRRIQAMDPLSQPEAVLQAVQRCAWFAGEFHPGRFDDGAIENVVLDIAAHLDRIAPRPEGYRLPVLVSQGRRRLLHVTPGLALGGHTRLLGRWIDGDRSSCHSILLTEHVGDVPDELAAAVRRSGGDIVVLPPGLALCQQAKWLREVARQSADLVVWHLIGADVVPTAAFGVPDVPPVALVGHGDHLFWLGTSVADVVVNLRPAALAHSAGRRSARRNLVLPIPLPDPPHLSRQEARRALGIEPDQTVLLSVGREIKYRPCGAYDFAATARRILERHPDAHLYIVGASPEGLTPWLRSPLHERVHLVGRVDEPVQYHAAADLYLESFPFGSQTALLESALSGLAVVPAYAPLFALLVADVEAVADLLPNPATEAQSLARTHALLDSREQRTALGQQLRERLLRDHVGQGWLDRLAAVYGLTDGLAHQSAQIPLSQPQASAIDIGLCLYQEGGAAPGQTAAAADAAQSLRIHAAVVAKVVGDYASARVHAWNALRGEPLRAPLWRLLLVAGLGRSGTLMRRALGGH